MVGANFLGSAEPGQGNVIVQASKGASAITKGDVLSLSSNKWIRAATTATGPFAVALESKASGDPTISILLKGIVYVTADGTINPNAEVKVSTATAGQVVAATVGTDAYSLLVGMYLGKENEGDGIREPTAAANDDVIRILLNGGGV